MRVPIFSGIYSDSGPDLRISYPVNMVPTPLPNGVSDGYLRPADGLVEVGQATGLGPARGGINWQGTLYRVMGTKLVSISADGTVTTLGDVGDGGPVSMTYDFDRLAVISGGGLYYYDGSTVTQVTDPDLGYILDGVWIDGYFFLTDGEFLIVTDLTDPTSINPLRYASAESNPDPIVAVLRLRGEVYAVGRYTIEPFDNVGGTGFPFDRNSGGIMVRGAVGTKACTVVDDFIAFVGGSENEAPGVWLGRNGQTQKISTVEIDRILADYTEAQLATAVLENRNDNAHQHLYLHLPDRTLVYDITGTAAAGAAIWFVLTSSLTGHARYRGRYFVWAYDNWQVADTDSVRVGIVSQTTSAHWGSRVRWEFATVIAYNESRGALFHELELVSLTGRTGLGVDPTVATSYSLDGVEWSQDRTVYAGKLGDRTKRIVWRRNGSMRSTRMQRFRGTSDAHLSVLRLEATLEPLAW